ncbi:MAG: hypothetical protein AAFV62_14005 [Pseudomonadota bacterium]
MSAASSTNDDPSDREATSGGVAPASSLEDGYAEEDASAADVQAVLDDEALSGSRLGDTAATFPLLGVFLLLPVFFHWMTAIAGPAGVLLYVFSVWAALVALAFLLAKMLRHHER